MFYKIFNIDDTWKVYSGYLSDVNPKTDDMVFQSNSIAECYAWIKSKQKNLIGF